METNVKRSDAIEQMMHENVARAIKSPEVMNVNRQIFYHYTDADGLLGILKEKAPVLRFSRFDCLNDVSEGQDIDEHFQAVCGSLLINPKYDKKKITAIRNCRPNNEVVISYDHQKLDLTPTKDETDLYARKPFAKFGAFQAEVYMCCFSSLQDLLPMWNYYSNGHAYQGYCIGFHPEMFDSFERYAHDAKGTQMDGCKLEIIKVIYDDHEKEQILARRITDILDYESYLKLTSENTKNYITIMLNSLRFVFKRAAFSHENEFRVIFFKPKNMGKAGLDESK
ncbi:MAG: DUF2971 domain-containing protein, partial [Lentisphaerae bacterium]|nr:DUF2971 domain-containing protein [Lentisphaerota bacterium]